jgi:hypothetical protein
MSAIMADHGRVCDIAYLAEVIVEAEIHVNHTLIYHDSADSRLNRWKFSAQGPRTSWPTSPRPRLAG